MHVLDLMLLLLVLRAAPASNTAGHANTRKAKGLARYMFFWEALLQGGFSRKGVSAAGQKNPRAPPPPVES